MGHSIAYKVSRSRCRLIAQIHAQCWLFVSGMIVLAGCSSSKRCWHIPSFSWFRRRQPTCNQLAALFEALQPKGKVTLSCGVPPATTGGFGRVAELSPKRFVLPDANAPRVAICARIAACGFREGAPLAASAACERASAKLGSCSAAADCAEVVRCSGISRKPHGTTSVVGSVSPKGNGWYGQADLAGNVWDVEPRLETRSWSWACEL